MHARHSSCRTVQLCCLTLGPLLLMSAQSNCLPHCVLRVSPPAILSRSRPGYYSTAAVDTCTACDVNKYQPASGQTSCINCPVGYETTNTANTECTPCAKGYYKNVEGMACLAAPVGTYVNTSAATTYTPW